MPELEDTSPSLRDSALLSLPAGVTQGAFLIKDLTVSRLNDIHNHLWLAGRVGYVRPLHRQRMMQREIVITEETNLHLVWHENRIYIKPLPKFLLHYEFFKENLCSSDIPKVERSSLYGEHSTLYKEHSTLHATACGLLLSYTQLIRHESDFRMAVDAYLIPPDLKVTWERWSKFAADIQSNVTLAQGSHTLIKANPRYLYGELRMTRLNLICRFMRGNPHGFHRGYTRYAYFFQGNFGWMLLAFAYLTVVLAAMQTVLTTDYGEKNEYIQRAACGFGIFSLLLVLIVVVLMLLIFVVLFLSNLLATLKHHGGKKKKMADLV